MKEFLLDGKVSLEGDKLAYVFLDSHYTHMFLEKFYNLGRYAGESTLAGYICEKEGIDRADATVLVYACYPGMNESEPNKNNQQKMFLQHEKNLRKQGIITRRGLLQMKKEKGREVFYEKCLDMRLGSDSLKIGMLGDPCAKYHIFFTFDCDFIPIFDDLTRTDHTVVLYTGNSERPTNFHTVLDHVDRHVHIREEDFKNYLLGQTSYIPFTSSLELSRQTLSF